ncbi:MAG: hypothetical protein ACI857_001303 [Arenicella sp.]|jgi:hypothetical protein
MKLIISTFVLLLGILSYSQDATEVGPFYDVGVNNEIGHRETIERSWGREVVVYLGVITWRSPSGKELDIKIVTSYQQITKANGFNDRSLIALVKTNHTLIKTYDLVKRQNLPIRIAGEMLIYKEGDKEVESPLPRKFSERFCVEGLTCFSEIKL